MVFGFSPVGLIKDLPPPGPIDCTPPGPIDSHPPGPIDPQIQVYQAWEFAEVTVNNSAENSTKTIRIQTSAGWLLFII